MFLLVEDNDSHALLFTRALQRCVPGRTLDRVSDGVEALAYLRREGAYQDRPTPDVVFMDLNMPRLDGFEALEQIKNDKTLKDIPIVILTTSDAVRDRVKAYTHHANSYVVKPTEFAEFRDMVRDLGFYWGTWNCLPR